MARSLVTIPEKQWTLVALNVTSGVLRLPMNMGAFSFYWTLRSTGTAAPSDTAGTDPLNLDSTMAQPLFDDSRDENISSSYAIDVYVWAQNSDSDSTDTAKVIADL